MTATGGEFNPGDGGPGMLTAFDDVTFGAGATFAVELNGAMAGAGYDQLSVQGGSVTLGGATLAVTLGFTPTVGDTFQIIDRPFGAPLAGTFAGLPQGARFDVDGVRFAIDYMGGSGNDVVLTVIPLTAPKPAPALDERGGVIAVLLLFVVGLHALRRLDVRRRA